MLIVDRQKRRTEVKIDLGRGATAIARTLDALEGKMVFAHARAEFNALMAGEPAAHDWTALTAERLKLLQGASNDVQSGVVAWMNTVLLAAETVTQIEGVVDGAGKPLSPSFELFELLFTDAIVELNFKSRALEIESLWVTEKNVSGPGPDGSGPEASIGAAPAVTPASPAPAAASGASATSSESAARSAPTPPAPDLASLPGSSPAAAAPGKPQA